MPCKGNILRFVYTLWITVENSLTDHQSDMEDAHTEILSLNEDPGTSFFGVFDGHGGEVTSIMSGVSKYRFRSKASCVTQNIYYH